MKIKRNYLWLLVLSCLAIFFVNLGSLPINIMEARNFITAREMLQDGSWLLTTINGEPRYQKPPLPTWLTAFSAAIFGIKNTWALRLPAALLALSLAITTFKLAKNIIQISSIDINQKIGEKYAFISALILSTSFYVIASGRDGQWDIYTHGFMLICIYFLYSFFTQNINTYRNAIIAGLFFGFSFLSKGPVSFYALLLPFLISFGIVYKFRNFKSRWIPLLLFLVIAVITSSWWHLYTIAFDKATALKITEKEATNWISYEVKPFYYYWSFFTQSGIWTIPAFISLLYPYLKNRVFNKKAYLFSFLWTMTSLILLSIIPEKKSRYLLPVLIPLALNTGFYMKYLFRRFSEMTDKRESFPVYFNFLLLGFIGIIFPLGGYFFLKSNLDGNWLWFILLSMCLFSIGILLFKSMYQKNIEKAFYLIIVFSISIIAFGLPLASTLNTNPEYKSMSALKEWEASEGLVVYDFFDMTPELIWDYGGKMQVLNTENGIKIPKDKTFGVLVNDENLDLFRQTFKNYHLENIDRYDMNTKDSSARTYRNRLYRQLFKLSKKSE